MNLDHMRRMCGWHFKVLGSASLNDYQFGPDLRGFASICSKAGSKVFGVLFQIDQQCLDILDEFEGYPDVFNRLEVEVTDNFGKIFKTWVYMEPLEQCGGESFREEYIRRALVGATENHLPETWVKFLKSFLPADKKDLLPSS